MPDLALSITLARIDDGTKRLAELNSGAKERFAGEKKLLCADLSKLNSQFRRQLAAKFPDHMLKGRREGRVLRITSMGIVGCLLFTIGVMGLALLFHIMITSFSYYPVP